MAPLVSLRSRPTKPIKYPKNMAENLKEERPTRRKNYQTRTKNIQVRFTYEQLEKFDLEAKNYGVNRSEYLRKKMVDGMLHVEHIDHSLRKLLFELNKVGVNLNQIAHRINENRVSNKHFEKQLTTLIDEIKSLVSEVKLRLK